MDRDGDTPIGKKSAKLDLQMGTSSANAIRASRSKVLRKQAGYKTAALPQCPRHANVTCDPGGAHIRPSLGPGGKKDGQGTQGQGPRKTTPPPGMLKAMLPEFIGA